MEPEFQRPESSTERDAPVSVLRHVAIYLGLQIAGIRRHDSNQMFLVPHVEKAGIQDCAHPLVWVPG